MRINRINKDTESEITIRLPIWLRVISWIYLLVIGPILIWGLVMILVGAGNEWHGINAFAFVLFLLGICGVSMTAKLKLNKPVGFMTVESWHVPIFFWLKRTRIISKKEARSVFVTSLDKLGEKWEWNIWGILLLLLSLGLVYPTRNVARKYYSIRLLTKSGKELELLTSSKMELANYLAKRIVDFSTQPEVTEDIMSTQVKHPRYSL